MPLATCQKQLSPLEEDNIIPDLTILTTVFRTQCLAQNTITRHVRRLRQCNENQKKQQTIKADTQSNSK